MYIFPNLHFYKEPRKMIYLLFLYMYKPAQSQLNKSETRKEAAEPLKTF